MEEHGEPEDEEGEAAAPVAAADPAPAPETQEDPQRAKWTETRPRVEEALAKAAASKGPDLAQARAAWAKAAPLAEAGDYAAALGMANETARLIAAAIGTARAASDAAARWQAAAAQLAPALSGIAAATTPEARKILAYWSFAQSKALATVPDFPSALTAVETLGKMIKAYRAVTAPPKTSPEAPPVTPEQNARLDAMKPEELARQDLTVGDTKTLFSRDYMLRLKDAKIPGEGSPDLKKLMQELAKGELPATRRQAFMRELAQVVGPRVAWEKLDADYGRFLVIQKQQAAIKAQKKKEDVPPLDEAKHKDFMASRGQLMFGKVLSDAFGIHEVFAAMLSPTGGLVGAGNDSLHLDPDNPVGIHGTVHDAAGYLASYHDEGPGYNYLEDDVEAVLSVTPLPDYLLGQLSGVSFWAREAGPAYVEKRIDEAVVTVEKKLKSARDAVATEVQKKIAEARRKAEEAKARAVKLAEAAEKKAMDIARAMDEAGEKAKKAAVETFDTASRKVGEIADEARKKLEDAWNSIWE